MPNTLAVRWSGISRSLQMVWLSIKIHHTTLLAAIQTDGLIAALTSLSQIRQTALAKLLLVTSPGFIAHENTTVVPSLITHCTGHVLELGSGPGNQLHRLFPLLSSPSPTPQITHLTLIEPNTTFVPALTTLLTPLGEKQYTLLPLGIENSGLGEGSVDTVLCIQVLCAVDDPVAAMRACWRLLKPRGRFVFWEHVKSADVVTGIAQATLNPSWSTFVGCHLNRDLKSAILSAGEWENPEAIEVDEEPYTCLPRIWGVLVKKA